MKIENKELVTVLEQSGIEKSQAEAVLEGFSDFFARVATFENRARAIKVTDASQVDDMKEARKIRLELKDIRVNAEKVRKERKEFFLRGGKAIDGIANVLKALVVPLEEHLERQENYVERLEEERKERVNAERIAALTPYVQDISVYNLKEMTDGAFKVLLETSKTAWQAQRDAEKKAEADRIEKEKADKAENDRIKKENERLRIVNERGGADRLEAEKKAEEAEVKRKKAEADLKARKDAEEREKREQAEREKKEAEDKKKLEKQKKYRAFREGHGWSEKTKGDFKEENTGDSIILYKKVGEFELK